MSKFKIGDKVEMINNYGSKCLKGKRGVVSKLRDSDGDCFLKLESGYKSGSIPPRHFKLYKKETYQIY